MSIVDHISRVSRGSPLSARRDGQILDAIGREETGPGVLTNALGTYHALPDKRRMCRFEMVDALTIPQSGSGYADARFLNWVDGDALDNLTPDEAGDTIRVVDSMRTFSKMATAQNVEDTGGLYGDVGTLWSDVGAYGLAWIPDDPMVDSPYTAAWEILYMQVPGMFVGELANDLTTSTPSVTVVAIRADKESGHITWEGYDPFGTAWALNVDPADPTFDITVYNLPGGLNSYVFEGSATGTVLCRWNARENKYYMIQVECPLDEQGAHLANWFFD